MAQQPTHADSILARYQDIGRRAEAEGNRLLQQNRHSGAVRVLNDAQRDLRDLKREVTEAERRIRLAATEARQKTTSSAQTLGMFGKTARSVAHRSSAIQKNQISQQQTAALAAYLPVKSAIDQLIADLTRMKDEIREDAKDVANDSSDRIPDPPITDVAPQWAADPARRHEMRWWDGYLWTEHVSDRGTRSTDPLT